MEAGNWVRIGGLYQPPADKVQRLLAGKTLLLGDRKQRVAKTSGAERHMLMRMHSAYEIAQTRKRQKLIRVRRVDKCKATGYS